MTEFETIDRDYSGRDIKDEGTKLIKIPEEPLIRVGRKKKRLERAREKVLDKINEYESIKQQQISEGKEENSFVISSIDKMIDKYEVRLDYLDKRIGALQRKIDRPNKLAVGSSMFGIISGWYLKNKVKKEELQESIEDGFEKLKEQSLIAPDTVDDSMEESNDINSIDSENVGGSVNEEPISVNSFDIPENAIEEPLSEDYTEDANLEAKDISEKVSELPTFDDYKPVDDSVDEHFHGGYIDVMEPSIDLGVNTEDAFDINIVPKEPDINIPFEDSTPVQHDESTLDSLLLAEVDDHEKVEKIAKYLYEQSLPQSIRETNSAADTEELLNLYREYALGMIRNQVKDRVRNLKEKNNEQARMVRKIEIERVHKAVDALNKQNEELYTLLAEEEARSRDLNKFIDQSNDEEFGIKTR